MKVKMKSEYLFDPSFTLHLKTLVNNSTFKILHVERYSSLLFVDIKMALEGRRGGGKPPPRPGPRGSSPGPYADR